MPRGGARAGAGRKPKATTHERAITRAEKRCADRLPSTLDNLEKLADGQAEAVEEIYEAAGALFIDATEIVYSESGNPRSVKVKKLAYPDLPPDELVLVKRVVRNFGPDRTANIYLADRILGKPTERTELSGPGGGAVPVAIQKVIEDVYGDDENTDAKGDTDETVEKGE